MNSVLLFCNNSMVTRFVYAHILKGGYSKSPNSKVIIYYMILNKEKNPESIAFGFSVKSLGGKKTCTKVLDLWVHLIHVRYAWAIYKHVISNIICPLVVPLIGWNEVSLTQNLNLSGNSKQITEWKSRTATSNIHMLAIISCLSFFFFCIEKNALVKIKCERCRTFCLFSLYKERVKQVLYIMTVLLWLCINL